MKLQLQSKVKSLIIERGYNSLADFAETKKVSYHSLRKLAYNRAHSVEVNFLLEICSLLGCEVGDLFVIKEVPDEELPNLKQG